MRHNASIPSLFTLHALWMIALLLTMAALTGCGVGRLTPPSAQLGVALHGGVHGGQQPVAGAHVYLFAANTTAYAGAGITAAPTNASISLLLSNDTGLSDNLGAYVLTDANGDFDISGDYECQPNHQVYLYAHGGNPGGGTNSAAGFLTLLGNCPAASNFGSVPFIEMNEVSTIAAAYAFAGFATDPTHVSTNGTAQASTGIANAFANAANLVDLGTGSALTTTPFGNGWVPTATINTLANILASCVNTADPAEPPVSGSPHPLAAHPHYIPYSSPCISLGEAVTGNNLNQFSGHAFDTATAAIFIAQNPGANVSALYTLPIPQAPFSPILTSQPNDFTLGIQFSGGGLDYPESLALDANGNVWAANYYASVSELSPLGVPFSPNTGFTNPALSYGYGIAIDTLGDAWVTNYGNNSISEIESSGQFLSSDGGFTGNGLSAPYFPAFNTTGTLWIPNLLSTTLSAFSASGMPASGSGFSGGGLDQATSVAIDISGNIWAANYGNSSITELSSGGTPLSPSTGFTGGGLSHPYSLAIDSTGNLWTANYSGNSLSKFSSAGAPLSTSSGFTGGGLAYPYLLAIDGSSNVWVSNYYSNSVSEFSNTGTAISPSTGFTGAGAIGNYPEPIAIDSSGNVWIGGYGDFVSELIGAATPVETPIVQSLQDFCIAQRPCTPPPI